MRRRPNQSGWSAGHKHIARSRHVFSRRDISSHGKTKFLNSGNSIPIAIGTSSDSGFTLSLSYAPFSPPPHLLAAAYTCQAAVSVGK
jgi:hypothetical protein